ncbi:MAG: hypothetical protein K2Q45_06825 [Nitrosomonas sp.]|nr:hypothetical protein [Nitrosomonas sp.]
MQGSIFLIALALLCVTARLPAYQKCISALSNFDGFDGNESLVVTFPDNYSEEELRQTVEQLGPLVLKKHFYADEIRESERRKAQEIEELALLEAEMETAEENCAKDNALLAQKNSKLWFWQTKHDLDQKDNCELYQKLNAKVTKEHWYRFTRGPPEKLGPGNYIKLKVY